MTTTKAKQESNHQIAKLFDCFKESVMELGIANTILYLENRNKNVFLDTSDVRIVTESVCEAFNIPEWVLFSNAKKYPRKYAFALWVSLCIVELNFSFKQVQLITGRARITIYKAKNFIDNYPNDSVFDNKIHEKIERTKQILIAKQNNK